MSLDPMAAKAFRVSSFTAVGHLLHINLKEHLLHHKKEIGDSLLERIPRALAVVNKVNSIDNTYRNFEIEIIAKRDGCEKTDEELMIVEVNENKCRFQLDFSKVYWNSRLCTEHERMINKFNKSIDIVFDLFAGIGPFSVPAAKAKCKTYANDLNPESIKWLNINMRRNKVDPQFFEISNIDAKDYIVKNLKEKLINEYETIEREELATMPKIHIIMNLPALAPTFLPYFVGLFKGDGHDKLLQLFKKQSLEHVIYCYCFLKGNYTDPTQEVRTKIEESFGKDLPKEQIADIFKVRNVAPYKDMYRVEINLDERILFDLESRPGIMRSLKIKPLTNGITKKVTINDPNKKRPHDESSSSINENNKKTKFADYCSIM